MVARLVECTNKNLLYGILTVENVGIREVREKINEIKKGFQDEAFEDWTIDDVLMAFPEEWEWYYEDDVGMIEI